MEAHTTAVRLNRQISGLSLSSRANRVLHIVIRTIGHDPLTSAVQMRLGGGPFRKTEYNHSIDTKERSK